ncbi:hypothetical protein GCM10010038_03420 [Glutamicibacter protophormiae]|nr:hypothetical protein GCM10010038_03420 [Glutamicibacter protophormiae]
MRKHISAGRASSTRFLVGHELYFDEPRLGQGIKVTADRRGREAKLAAKLGRTDRSIFENCVQDPVARAFLCITRSTGDGTGRATH